MKERRWTLGDRARISIGAGLDRLGVAAGKRMSPFQDVDAARIRAETEQALELYERRGWLESPMSLHQIERQGSVLLQSRHHYKGHQLERVHFDAGYRPDPDEPGAERWIAHVPNSQGHVRLFEHHGPPRPWVICVHGTGMGSDALDFRAFDVPWLHVRLGLNVALPVLPLSGSRRQQVRYRIEFPTIDQLDNLHAMLASLAELQMLVGLLRDRGAPQVSLTGVSLGGYITAAAAGAVTGIDRVIPGIPATDLQQLWLEQTPTDQREQYEPMLEAGRRLHTVVSPLVLEPLVPFEHRYVYAAIGDRMVPSRAQASRLWEAWGRPASCWYSGGHVTFPRSAEVRRFLRLALGS